MAGRRSSHTAQVREALLGILRDSWPQPWFTGDLRDAFGPGYVHAVYPALQQLQRAGDVWTHAIDGCRWWAGIIDGAGPRCSCGHAADRLLRLFEYSAELRERGEVGWRGGYTCGEGECTLRAVTQQWPWPMYDELHLGLVVPPRRVLTP